jgi:hypothetical protein
MAWVKAKNPASSLMLINPKRGKKMAVRRRRRTATNTRRRTTAAVNPRRRRRNRTTIYAAAPRRTNRRRSNPVRRRRRSRNPQVKVFLQGAVLTAVGAMAQGVAAGLIPIRAPGIMGIGIEAAVAWGVWMVADKVVGGQNAMYIGLGASAGVGKSILNYFLGLAQSGVGALTQAAAPPQLPPAAPQVGDITYYDGVGDIVAEPEYWPGY